MNKPSLTILMMLIFGSAGAAVWNFNDYRPYPVEKKRAPAVRVLEVGTKLAELKRMAPARLEDKHNADQRPSEQPKDGDHSSLASSTRSTTSPNSTR